MLTGDHEKKKKKSDTRLRRDRTAGPSLNASAKCRNFDFNLKCKASHFKSVLGKSDCWTLWPYHTGWKPKKAAVEQLSVTGQSNYRNGACAFQSCPTWD